MSKDLNVVEIIGRLGKDPEVRYTQQGSSITKFTVASGRRWRTTEGEERDATEWFNIVAFEKLGETCAEYLQKGARVYIEGRLQTRSWDDQATGQKRYITEIVANDMIMLDSRRDSAGGGAPGYEEQDVGYQEPEPEIEAPAPEQRSYAQRPDNGRAASPQPAARVASNGNGAPARPAQQQRPAQPAAARRQAAPPPPTDEDDLPF